MTTPGAARGRRLQWRSFSLLLLGAAFAATLLIGTLLWSARQDALRSAQVTALNYARTLEVRLDATFRRADSLLQTLAQQVPPEALSAQAEPHHGPRLNSELAALMSGFDELIALRLIDAQGDQRYVSAPTGSAVVNYADRSFYKTYLADPQAGLLFSEVVTGRVSQRPTVVMTRPLRDADGRFRGAVLAPMDLGYFQQQFRKLDVGAQGVVFLRRAEAGQLVLRWPQIDAEVNRPMPRDQPILLAVQAGRDESVHEYTAFTDGVRRISGTVLVKGYPFFLTVALSTDEVLASWRRLALAAGLTWVVVLLLLGASVWRLQRMDRERGELEAQLRESRRIESLGTLAGGIAHDFNNIVAAILGNVALARADLGPDHPAQRSLEQIGKAGARARDLVRQIMAFGRRQAALGLAQPLQPLVEEAMALLRPLLPPDVALEARLVPQPLHARVDATQMQQVLTNLGTNAWHALQGRPGRIEFGLDEQEPPRPAPGAAPAPGPHAHLWVHDDGSGMDAATRERVFEPFFTTKPTGQGAGLGLSVVHGIVVAHGGSIRIDSAPGRGTTVHLYFPRVAAAPEAPPAVPAPAARPGAPAGAGQHVLYVDDDEVLVLMVERLLVQAGYRVSTCSGGREALLRLQSEPQAFDLVVSDFNMPGFDGLELAQALAALRPGLPVVISSGYLSDELRERAHALGVRALLQKQDTLEELPGLVDGLLRR